MQHARRPSHGPLSVAPMVDRTDRHFRSLMRLITRHTLLYSEMVVARAILRGDHQRLLAFDPNERPLALQLAGDEPGALAEAARIAADYGYDEINLNVGCPSPRVQRGRFGACLMAEPQTVADCVAAMRAAVTLPVTVKHRIGIEGREQFADLAEFVEIVALAGCDRFVVHARIAVLGGLNPKQNRSVPPLRYDDVYALKRHFGDALFEINGGIATLDQAAVHLKRVDGVMIGRAAYDDPMLFAAADARFFGGAAGDGVDRIAVVEAMVPYVERWVAAGGQGYQVLRHMQGLFNGMPGARRWRRMLSVDGPRSEEPGRLLRAAIAERR
ncbi:MAG: tRNA dihydrouridine(20/20a) synthase DusA [Deltaproteobacteria bacterium]|nr:tRNA dihydrouridine(20/20a) synthase DusA [Deltaproteobacteria bacterium]